MLLVPFGLVFELKMNRIIIFSFKNVPKTFLHIFIIGIICFAPYILNILCHL